MLSIITSYLIQTGKCALPYIGYFTTDYKPAVTDIVSKQIFPPVESIIFREEAIPLSAELINYIASKRNVSHEVAGGEFDEFCKQWNKKIDAGEKLCFETLGCLQKSDQGVLIFVREKFINYNGAVLAERVLHHDAGHSVLVGDNETTSAAMNKYYSSEPVIDRKTWRIWALALFFIALLLLIFSFYNHRFSPSSVGNRSKFTIDSAGETHK